MSESASSQLITCPGGTFTGTIHHHAHGNVATYDPIVYGKLTSEFAPALHVYSPTESKDPAAHNNLRTQLHLTVTTPAHARKFNDLPVIAVIHGGGYDSGSRNEFSFDGTALAQTGVIVVSIDYRLGIQGFARFHDDPPHHYRGIDDCALALEWIQNHIEDFGGDPTNVTLFGQSAGAGIALWLTRRDHYRGMFRRVWAASPSFPRGEMKRRKAALRWALSAPITQSGLEELRRKRLEKGYNRYKRYFPTDLALGPWDYDPNELTAIPIIISSTDRELYQLPAAQQADTSTWLRPLRKRVARQMGATPEYIEQNSTRPDFFRALTGTSMIHRWVKQTLKRTYGDTWYLRYTSSSDHEATHCSDLRLLFHSRDSQPDSPRGILLRFVRGNAPSWPQYRKDASGLEVCVDGVGTQLRTDSLRGEFE
ncbi:alpha/beta fold hydrolase [Corynebacterium pseudotuberculosis]|uniref:Carboxylic ester hydrolase n=1 Tax=Corynebacterium pseudotuberculosis 258 TaxID=1168865 RepID=A0AAU8PLJ3_CORPS|nr:carboxylesterase family protein [Corynebacterium pseudotuberculosis]AEQ07073.1 carboxylesterase family protein [Corynebacterium pseudotuberculosis CIP 52.97]AFB72878.2 carboxylesterase family protein [Corynebacterium pseudotuberculosis 316]AFK17170.3 carboxylesterase family protein [Corynebacterium pseudotuberculosis 258]AMN70417.1 alpha/beta fold hydrolase [Corynebacterium pseudotuberculosis]AMN72268.1 carboxylesterase [Corynebacterium pseudotuberculosis]